MTDPTEINSQDDPSREEPVTEQATESTEEISGEDTSSLSEENDELTSDEESNTEEVEASDEEVVASDEDVEDDPVDETENEEVAESVSEEAEGDEDETEGEEITEPVTSEAKGDEDAAESEVAEAEQEEDEEPAEPVNPLAAEMEWFVLKVQTNQENNIKNTLEWTIRREGIEDYFGEIVIPIEKVKEKTKTGKTRNVKRKLFPGYMMIQMVMNEETWYLVRETNSVGDFAGSAGKPIPMTEMEVQRMLGKSVATAAAQEGEAGETEAVPAPKVDIPYSAGDTVKITDGSFIDWEGVVDAVDTATGKITVLVQILGQSTPVELEYWQVENN